MELGNDTEEMELNDTHDHDNESDGGTDDDVTEHAKLGLVRVTNDAAAVDDEMITID